MDWGMRMQPSEDERVLAALSHASIVANVVNLVGMIGTALIWTMHRERSPYVRAHALQALVYQGAVLLITLFLGLFGGLCLTSLAAGADAVWVTLGYSTSGHTCSR